MKKNRWQFFSWVLLFTWLAASLSGCSALTGAGLTPPPVAATGEPTTGPTRQPAAETVTLDGTSPPASPAPGTPSSPVTLQVWLPPQFDSATGSPGGDLIQARLDEFARRRSGIRIETRIKDLDGPGGMLDSLTGASAAAPLALPDLVALPRPLLETAALKGLLYPLDAVTDAMESNDWYEWARQLSRVQSSTFGLPFAGDALVLLHRPSMVNAPPASWQATLEKGVPLAFAAADPQALFTLALYRAAGGTLQDDQGRPTLERGKLTEVFSFYQTASKAEVMPYWLTQYQNDDQVWQEVIDRNISMGAIWASRYLTEAITDTAVASIPTPDGAPFTWATGWVWAVAAPHPEQQELSAELAEFLTESDFLAGWALASGTLPPRPSGLTGLPDGAPQAQFSAILEAAQVYPSADMLASLGPVLQEAVINVLKQQQEAEAAAQATVERLNAP